MNETKRKKNGLIHLGVMVLLIVIVLCWAYEYNKIEPPKIRMGDRNVNN